MLAKAAGFALARGAQVHQLRGIAGAEGEGQLALARDAHRFFQVGDDEFAPGQLHRSIVRHEPANSGSVAPGGVRKLIVYSPPASDSQPPRMSSNSRCHSFQTPAA
jgi:hypothetical protein